VTSSPVPESEPLLWSDIGFICVSVSAMDTSALLVPPQSDFTGTVGEIVEEFVMQNLPAADALLEWTESLLRYAVEDPDPIHVVRGPEKGHLRRLQGSLIVDSDNAPAAWCFLSCFDRAMNAADLPSVIREGQIPILMALAAQKRPWWNYGRELTAAEKVRLKVLQVKHCHMLPTGARGLSPQQRFLRNLCPLNHFLFPSPKRFCMSCVGWSERNGGDLGESESVIGWIQQRMIQRLGKQGELYDRFLLLAGGSRSNVTSSELRIQIHHRGGPEHRGPTSSGSFSNGSGRSSKMPGDAARYSWTLNEEHGFYTRTAIKHNRIALSLLYRTSNGMIAAVGEFVLDLAKLSALEVVSSRRVHNEVVYCVRIVRERDGSYWLRVRDNFSLDLRMLAA
jgi:hypothetical protein